MRKEPVADSTGTAIADESMMTQSIYYLSPEKQQHYPPNIPYLNATFPLLMPPTPATGLGLPGNDSAFMSRSLNLSVTSPTTSIIGRRKLYRHRRMNRSASDNQPISSHLCYGVNNGGMGLNSFQLDPSLAVAYRSSVNYGVEQSNGEESSGEQAIDDGAGAENAYEWDEYKVSRVVG